jgi:hypothetical protein
MKILKAKEQLGQEIYALTDIYPMSDITTNLDVVELHKSLAKGMNFPIILYPVIVSQWRTESIHNILYIAPPKHLNDSDVVLQIKCGCNRYNYAKAQGFTHIEAIKTEQGDEVVMHMQASEKWWKKQ